MLSCPYCKMPGAGVRIGEYACGSCCSSRTVSCFISENEALKRENKALRDGSIRAHCNGFGIPLNCSTAQTATEAFRRDDRLERLEAQVKRLGVEMAELRFGAATDGRVIDRLSRDILDIRRMTTERP